MLPKFPDFIKLSFDHKPHIEKHVSKHPPYSDFNFTSLITWGGEETNLSELNDNLVIKFRDYITNEPFYTFIGLNKINETIEILLKESIKNNLHPKLKLIPEVTLKANPEILEKFDIQEDRDNFDYIYLLKESSEFIGNKYGAKRNFINRFKKNYQSSHKIINLSDIKIHQKIVNLFDHWHNLKGKEKHNVENELLAIKKVLEFAKDLNLLGVGIYIDSKLVAFSINEVLADGYTINLFEKADINYMGIFPYLRQISANYLLEKGGIFLSHEQDLGIEGLRKSKLSYNPSFFLKKYTISKKT